MKTYEISLDMTGSISIQANSQEEALDIVREMSTEELLEFMIDNGIDIGGYIEEFED